MLNNRKGFLKLQKSYLKVEKGIGEVSKTSTNKEKASPIGVVLIDQLKFETPGYAINADGLIQHAVVQFFPG